MIVKLEKKNARYQDLTRGKRYVVIGIEAGELRILNDVGCPFLYPPDLFSLVDQREPVDWVTEFGDDGDIHIHHHLTSPVSSKTFSTRSRRRSRHFGA